MAIKAIAQTAHALNELRPGRVCFDLLAQVQNVRVDDAVTDVGALLPGRVDELLAGQHAAASLDESLQEAEFESRQRHGNAIPADDRAFEIHFQGAESADAQRGAVK